MINKFKSKLEELEQRKKELQPKIEELNAKKDEEIAEVNKKYDHLIYEVNYEVEKVENEINNEMVDSFVKIVMKEFDAKRSTSEYTVTDEFKEYKDSMTQFKMFPKELIDKLHQVINGEPIENIAYDLEKIEKNYKKS
jgi:enoyl-[acyl-carrier-protein] reductase (NADH)